MSFLDEITPVVLTYNEAPNIARTLAALDWARHIVVVDSGSTDETLALIAAVRQAKVVRRSFDDFARQWDFGLSCVTTPWALTLDADYFLNRELVAEIARLSPDEATSGYEATFRYCVLGRPLRASLYPPRVVLVRQGRAHHVLAGHTQRVVVAGAVGRLAVPIDHDDRKSHARWLASQQRYAREEATHILAQPPEDLRRTDRIRRMGWPAPILVFLYTLIVKRCILDGWPGWLYVLQRTLAEFMIATEIVDRRLRGASEAQH